ncbi:MAG TPA: hypothetical protein DDX54_06400 [Rhodospirillaceae bacterium]|nr:hypothetical protein [Rhodospirillaceae bacterium]
MTNTPSYAGSAAGGLYDQTGEPTYVICPCCDCESGYQDAIPESTQAHRARWMTQVREAAENAALYPWHEPAERPQGWDMQAQLARIPKEHW